MAKQVVIYLDTDLETGGYNTPLRLEDGTIVQGADYFPILQVAAQLCDSRFDVVDVLDLMIAPDDERMSHMNAETWAFHCKNGFDQIWANSQRVTVQEAERQLLEKLHHFLYNLGLVEEGEDIPDYKYDNKFIIMPHGKSVNFDRTFFNFQMPTLAMKLCHQTSDVSAVRALMRPVKDWPYLLSNTRSTHLALDDCEAARQDALIIREALSKLIVPGHKTLEDMVRPPKSSKVSVLNVPMFMGLWNRKMSYEPNVTVEYEGKVYFSNDYVPDNVPFVIGEKGATWRSMAEVEILDTSMSEDTVYIASTACEVSNCEIKNTPHHDNNVIVQPPVAVGLQQNDVSLSKPVGEHLEQSLKSSVQDTDRSIITWVKNMLKVF